jgi:hypothetical protein
MRPARTPARERREGARRHLAGPDRESIGALVDRDDGDRMQTTEAWLARTTCGRWHVRTGSCTATFARRRILDMTPNDNRREGATMFFRAFVAMLTADAFDRHMRDQQYRAWAAAEETRAAAANAPHRPLFAPPAGSGAYDLRQPERPNY